MTHFPYLSPIFHQGFPFCKTFPFLACTLFIPSVYSYTLLVCAHEPALYPLVYIPRLGYDVLPRFDIKDTPRSPPRVSIETLSSIFLPSYLALSHLLLDTSNSSDLYSSSQDTSCCSLVVKSLISHSSLTHRLTRST